MIVFHFLFHSIYLKIVLLFNKDAESVCHPTDYLLFFAPCKSEGPDQLPEGLLDPEPDTPAALGDFLKLSEIK